MTGIGDLVAKLSVNSAPWKKGLKGASSSLSSFVGGIAGPLAAAGGALAGVWGGAKSVSAYKTQLDAQAKLGAVLKSTGGAAGLSAKDIAGYASELQSVTNFGDEATISAAGVLATFKEVKGDVFKDAIALAQDMTAVLGGDMQGKILQVGKALDDPIKGVSALYEAGVGFSEQQKKQIELMQKSGNMAGAQAIIMQELQSQFGGAAKAMANPMTQLGNIVGDAAEMFGSFLYPAISAVSSLLSGVVGGVITDFGGAFESAGNTVAAMFKTNIAPAIESVVGRVTGFVKAVMAAGPETTGVAGVVAAAIRGIGNVVGGVSTLVRGYWKAIATVGASVFSGILQVAKPVFQGLSDNYATIKGIAVGYYGVLSSAASAAWEMVTSLFSAGFEFIRSAGAAAFALLESTGIASLLGIGGESSTTFAGIGELVVTALAMAEFAFTNWRSVAELAFKSVLLGIVTFANEVHHHFTVRIPAVLTWFADNWQKVLFTAFDYTATIFINLGKNIRSIWSATLDFVSGNGFNPDFTPLTEGAKSMIDSLPNVPERIMGDFEKSLSSEVSSLNTSLGASMDSTIAQRLKALEAFENKTDTTTRAHAAKTEAAVASVSTHGAKIPAPPQPTSQSEEHTKFAGNQNRGSDAAFTTIVKAMQNGNRDPQVGELKKNTSAVTKAGDKIVAAIKDGIGQPETRVQGAV